MTREYARKSKQSSQKDADSGMLQRTATRSLPATRKAPQGKSKALGESSVKQRPTQIPTSDRSTSVVQPKLMVGRENETDSQQEGLAIHEFRGHSGELISERFVRKGDSASPIQRQEEGRKAENRTGLPDSLKKGIENLSGYSMDDVRVHYNSEKPAQLQALAYTQGTDIHVATGQEGHLPHEAWHVVQQMQGRVRPTMEVNGYEVNGDRGLEREAGEMGTKALRQLEGSRNGEVSKPTESASLSPKSEGNTIQRLVLVNNVLVSTFDKTKVITESQAVITARSSDRVYHGGHARLFLEYLDAQGEGVAKQLDLYVNEAGKIEIELVTRQKEYKPSNPLTKGLYNRSISGKLEATGNYQAYTIKKDGIQKAIAKKEEIEQKAKNGKIGYGFAGNSFLNLLPFGTTKMNCAEFVAEVMKAAEVSNASAGLFGMPSTVSAIDTRTNQQIYNDAKQKQYSQ